MGSPIQGSRIEASRGYGGDHVFRCKLDMSSANDLNTVFVTVRGASSPTEPILDFESVDPAADRA